MGPLPGEVEDLWRDTLRARLRRGERPRLSTEGHSMWPAIRAGETVLIVPLGPGEPRLGQVVLVVAGGRNVLHRVVAIDGDRCLLKGDATPRPDGWVSRGDLIGGLAPRPADRLRAVVSRVGGPPLSWLLGLLRTRVCPASSSLACSRRGC